MEVTRLVSVCLSVLVLSQVLLANPYGSRDTDTALGEDVANLAQDLVRLFEDARRESSESSDERRAKRYVHFNIGSDHQLPRRSYRNRRIHHDRRRARGGVQVSRV
ncbi:uncharacterized protein LOC124279949 [Haliotis rubra]|uniref:uncharacterized protein LOC124279949 n=1 Tax=Haliotis rubra TaxID=36100 RepID=UPI001EE54755|nr:uncharacterized protein LOC124279949 [Haliotis rubra]